MDCKYTCFDRVLNLVKPLPEDKRKEGFEVATKYSFSDLLDFGVECGCFANDQAKTIYEGIVMWEDLEGNYWEEDYDKLMSLYDKMGIPEEV